ncbi:HSP18 transcriptional regulator [Saccharopolyspora phatthalungensis]|uniref:HSP18 transcriptional regulator n=1 Tax=Saccharopolyspora phatthalungensis TaxID=664693 RepID=A0A840QBH2_9PSEU|nr:HSP18 transcriptional regulator [Saccharopolyspora phatthalungensis]MBB5157287.1 hypothetical protein [Saccharopolyspora phatthalungensis]
MSQDSPSEALRHLTALLERIRTRQDTDVGTDDDGVGRVLDGLTLLRELRTELAGWEPELIAAARRAGASWAQLAPALGVASRQAAERRYLRLQSTGGPETTMEARVQATRDRRAGDRAVTAWARQNSAELRQLAGQVSAVGGLSAAGQREAERVHAELAGNDPASLLGPLTDLRAHLADEHPALADRITTVTADADQRRRTTVHNRHPAGHD